MNAKSYGKMVESGTVTVTSVELNRAEGPTELCGKSRYATIAEANAALQMWAADMPIDQLGYDKVDFKVHFSDGGFYSGRFDMKPSHRSGASLKVQMVETVRYYAECSQYAGTELAKNALEELPFYEAL